MIEGELGAALALPGQAPDRVARFRVDGPTGPCECQAWTPGDGVMRLAWRPSVTGVHSIAYAPEFAAAPHEAPPFAVREGDAIRIDNGALRAVFRDSPLVRVEVVVTQASAFAWKELHVLDIRATAAGRAVPVVACGRGGGGRRRGLLAA